MGWLVPAGIALVSVGLMYLMCIRPMRSGHCMTMSDANASDGGSQDAAEIAQLRAEVAALHRDLRAADDPVVQHPSAP